MGDPGFGGEASPFEAADLRDEAVARLWLLRHAAVAGARDIIHGPDAPADIGDLASLERLGATLPANAPVLCSPARRTHDTARVLGLTATEKPALREQDFGDWIGRRHADLARAGDKAYLDFWRAPATNRPPGGESFAEQIARTGPALMALPAGDTILVVHSGTVRAALAVALDLPPETALRIVVEPLSLTRIDRVGDGWRVVCVNRRCPV